MPLHLRGASADDVRPVAPAPAPARPRLIARARRLSFGLFAALLLVGGLGGWYLSSAVGTWPTAAHAAALGLAVTASAALAWRSTREVEHLFHQEDRLLRSVVHEIRAPLQRLMMTLDLGSAGMLPADQVLKVATVEAEGLQELLDDLVEAAKVMSGSQARPSERMALDEVVARTARQVAVEPVRVEVVTVPTEVIGSPRLVRLAVTNLVRNAARHGYVGGPGVVRVSADGTGITVDDDGPGIDPTRLADLRRDLPLGLRRAGSGLGLALAAWVAEVHGGRLLLENRAMGGFRARIELPVEERPA